MGMIFSSWQTLKKIYNVIRGSTPMVRIVIAVNKRKLKLSLVQTYYRFMYDNAMLMVAEKYKYLIDEYKGNAINVICFMGRLHWDIV